MWKVVFVSKNYKIVRMVFDNKHEYLGIGMISKGQMLLAYGGINFEYELVIFSIEINDGITILKGKYGCLNNGLAEETLVRC